MPTKSIAVPDAIYDRVQEVAAADGTTVEKLATKALDRDSLVAGWTASGARETCDAAS